jgi:hypothetical protein
MPRILIFPLLVVLTACQENVGNHTIPTDPSSIKPTLMTMTDPEGDTYTETMADDGTLSETWFSSAGTDAACPPNFPSKYRSPAMSYVFYGTSKLTMAQWDEYHTYRVYTYQFTGYTFDNKWKVTGVHHVADVQCTAAAASYWGFGRAWIARLHGERLSSLASSGGCGSTQVTEAVYDPYAQEEEFSCDAGGSGGSGGGSGTQYYPGDNTGGETVNWGTGIGNGGSSSCGSMAVVQYVCIDYWDGDSWEEWSCGYATTC